MLDPVDLISGLIGNRRLAQDVVESIAFGLEAPTVHLVPGNDVWTIFNLSLAAATRDVATHPRGVMLQRLIKYGPLGVEGEPLACDIDPRGAVDDKEWGSCLEFVFSHMINRFKGELAEMLSVGACAQLLQEARFDDLVPLDAVLWWGDAIRQRRRLRLDPGHVRWGGYAKGADGLIVATDGGPNILGIIEVKSMDMSGRRVLAQIDRHIARLDGGVRLLDQEFGPESMRSTSPDALLRIVVKPAKWRLSRRWDWREIDGHRALVFPDQNESPPALTTIQRTTTRTWEVTLAWSHEALEQAAYEMTFWYMGRVGEAAFTPESPSPWDMSPDEAGRNSIKEALYHIGLRPLTARQDVLWRGLYNVYGFGYVLGIDAKRMLWPQDFR